MPLQKLIREYEERRVALINQLKANPNMDAATQHQIYGAIKEIENFLASAQYQLAQSQEQQLGIELSRERERPFVDRTKRIAKQVGGGAARVVTHHIPNATMKLLTGPKRYLDSRRERKALRKQIEKELLARIQHEVAASGSLPQEVHSDMPPAPAERTGAGSVSSDLEPAHSSTSGDALRETGVDTNPNETVGRKRPTSRKKKKPAKKKVAPKHTAKKKK